MITRYIIAETVQTARAALNVYVSLPERDRAFSERVHITKAQAEKALDAMRTDPEADHHNRAWARACTVWCQTYDSADGNVPRETQGE